MILKSSVKSLVETLSNFKHWLKKHFVSDIFCIKLKYTSTCMYLSYTNSIGS